MQVRGATVTPGPARRRLLRLALALGAAAALLVLALHFAAGETALSAMHWASEQQQAFQNAMAGMVRAIRAGNLGAVAGLCGLGAAYGFVHAVGPGHGKVLLGGAALAGGISRRRIYGVGLAASLAQSACAILLVAIAAHLLSLSAMATSDIAEGLLASASRWAIAALGLLIAWRGLRALVIWLRRGQEVQHHDHHHHHHDHGHEHDHSHGPGCSCGHAHGPSAAELAGATGPRDLLLIVLSIALRPCTGAIFLLIVAFRFDIPLAGIAAVICMGLGTFAFNSIAITGGWLARRLASGPLSGEGLALLMPALQLAAGLAIAAITLGLRL